MPQTALALGSRPAEIAASEDDAPPGGPRKWFTNVD
jgi:hypothetical protein